MIRVSSIKKRFFDKFMQCISRSFLNFVFPCHLKITNVFNAIPAWNCLPPWGNVLKMSRSKHVYHAQYLFVVFVEVDSKVSLRPLAAFFQVSCLGNNLDSAIQMFRMDEILYGTFTSDIGLRNTMKENLFRRINM